MPSGVRRGRFTAELDGDLVVSRAGLRVNRRLKVHERGPVFVARVEADEPAVVPYEDP